ncbi:MAG: DMT family transporter [Candidatus Moranbacteria bacterium]|nr:DMT family transporter [Candidatus Moranbacteria bacterium]
MKDYFPIRTSSAFGVLELVLASLIRGFQGFFVRVTEWTPNHIIPLAFFRLSVPAALIYVYLFLTGRRIRGIFTKEKLPLHLISLLTAIRMSFFFLGYAYADLSSATLIFFASGIFITLLEPFFLKEKFSRQTLWLALLGFVGIAFVFLDQTISLKSAGFIGLVFMGISCFLVIFENICKKSFIGRASNFEWVFYQGFVSSLFLSVTLFFFPLPDARAFLWIMAFALIIGIGAFVLDMSAIRKVRISDLSVVRYVEPIATMCVGFFLYNEAITMNKLIGAVLIFSSVYFVFKKQSIQRMEQEMSNVPR